MTKHPPQSFADRHESAPFSEPWEIKLFALTEALRARGVLRGEDWRNAFGAELAQDDQNQIAAPAYYMHWLTAFEAKVAELGLTDVAALERTKRAWLTAAERTPHGTPIELRDSDFSEPNPGSVDVQHSRTG